MEVNSAGKREYGGKEYELSTGRVWAAGFHHVTVRSRLARVLKLTKLLFFNVLLFRLTVDTELVDTGARVCFVISENLFVSIMSHLRHFSVHFVAGTELCFL
jgi:hypothetical protein